MKTSGLIKKLTVLLLCVVLQPVFAQERETMQKLLTFPQNISTFNNNYPQEKVYLHFDNTSYYSGENIWFKAYVVNAGKNQHSDLSKILYVDLVSSEGYIIDTKKLKINDGQCNGSFRLTSSNQSGFYEIRAYTGYMLNFGSGNYFSRVFPIYDKPATTGEYNPVINQNPNSQRIPEIRNPYSQKENISLTFYPEGGNLIAGLISRVGFKATYKDGSNANVTGAVYNQLNEKVAEFRTTHSGMGVFEFTPNSGKFIAKVKYNNKEEEFELPPAIVKGYVLRTDNTLDNIYIQIQKTANTDVEKLGLCLTTRGIVQKIENIDFQTDMLYSLEVPKAALMNGVTLVTLYNDKGEVKCERMIFVKHNNQLKINLTQSKNTYMPFEKAEMTFSIHNKNNQPVETTFSVSVRDAATSSSNPANDNILTNLLLSSELRGYIENPGYYFDENNDHSADLDVLMLVQGWNRYTQIAQQNKTFKLKYPVEKNLEINGKILSLFRKNKMNDVDITMLLSANKVSQVGKSKTDSEGKFGFILNDFTGTGKLTIQTKQNGKPKETYIQLIRNELPELKTLAFAEKNQAQYFNRVTNETNISEPTDNVLTDQLTENTDYMLDKKAYILKEVTIKEKRTPIKVSVKYDVAKELDRRRDNGEWIPDNVGVFLHFTSDYYNASTGRYKGKYVIFVRDMVVPGSTEYSQSESDQIPGLTNNLSGGQMPYLDEIESISFIEDYNSILRIYKGIPDPSNVVIALIRCKYDYRKEPWGIRNTTYTGFSPVQEFFNPQYDKMILPDEKDYRRTLYWNPNVRTDHNGKANIVFYNNGSCKMMNVSVETVTNDGLIGELNK